MKPRGRPRRFDPAEAVARAQQLFHARGYDSVSLVDLTEALGIRPPSFYAAFGSKAGLHQQVLERYATHGAVPFAALMKPDRPVAENLRDILRTAATLYSAAPDVAGCMVIEGMHSVDAEASRACCAMQTEAAELIRQHVAARHPCAAQAVTDYIAVTLAGMSSMARRGYGVERLLKVADTAAAGLPALLHAA